MCSLIKILIAIIVIFAIVYLIKNHKRILNGGADGKKNKDDGHKPKRETLKERLQRKKKIQSKQVQVQAQALPEASDELTQKIKYDNELYKYQLPEDKIEQLNRLNRTTTIVKVNNLLDYVFYSMYVLKHMAFNGANRPLSSMDDGPEQITYNSPSLIDLYMFSNGYQLNNPVLFDLIVSDKLQDYIIPKFREVINFRRNHDDYLDIMKNELPIFDAVFPDHVIRTHGLITNINGFSEVSLRFNDATIELFKNDNRMFAGTINNLQSYYG